MIADKEDYAKAGRISNGVKLLFVNPFGIGDVLFTTPLMGPLKKRGNSIFYWCNERVVDILKYNRGIDAIFSLSRGDLKRNFKISAGGATKKLIDMVKRIRKERFDLALDFSLDYRYSLLLRLLGVKRIAGFDYKGRGRFLTDRIKIDGFDGRHMVEHYAKLLKLIDRTLVASEKMELFIGGEEEKSAHELLMQRGVRDSDILVGIAAGGGSSWGKDAFRKQWPKERFANVADELASRDKYKIMLFGNGEERDICNFISAGTDGRIINLCGKTSLGLFAALLKRCKLLITNDGGPLHMASALGVKTVSIFGPVDEKVYGPYQRSEEHNVIKVGVECRPCYKNFRYPMCSDRVCLDSLEPSAVLEAVRNKLK